MIALPRPEVVITHESDLDGLVAGLLMQQLAQRMHNQRPPLEAYAADHWRQRALRESAAWVADFALEPRLDLSNWVVLDHHPTQTVAKNAVHVFAPDKSAALIVYELCREQGLGSPELDRLVHLCNVSDLFLRDDPDFLTAMDHASLVKSYQFWNLHDLIEGELERLLDHPLLEVMSVKRRVEDPIGCQWSRSHLVEISPTVGLVDMVLGNQNLILDQLLEEKASPHPVLASLYRKGGGTIIVSLRSRNGEALAIAQRLQGGGHHNAAGAVLPRTIQRIPDAVDYLRKVLNPAPPRPATPFNSLESIFDEIQSAKPGNPQ
ncbi:MAG TPA: DHHA1 domain-containing protein [Candidatus Paceibacterota bacterium]|nr:DHHA1 domain-containing protein [Verrucomicrobiota bacterium]HRZ44875.1 DHHA1 domain-containing protein [Candidatus Paceibacterota bacterium]